MNNFTSALGNGSNTPNTPTGENFTDGFRSINWDAAPDSIYDPNSFPGDFFNTAFAGIRREELYPDTRSKKEGLQWEHFRWEEKLIILPPKVSKTGQKRTIPICDLLLNLLAPFQSASGRCCVGKPPEKTNHGKISETARLGGLIGGWKNNALRHSFVSYRCALVGPGIAALEAGNSEAMTRSTYLDSKSKSEAEDYFGVEHFENTLKNKS